MKTQDTLPEGATQEVAPETPPNCHGERSPRVYVRCPDCHGYSADPYSGEDCQLCHNVGNVSEEYLIERLGKEEADELLDFYHRRGKFKDVKAPRISHIFKGYDA